MKDDIFQLIFIDVLFDLVVNTTWEAPQTSEQNPSIHQPNISDTHTLQKQTKCPRCQRTVAVSRFAPHLEKCLGMGRQAASKPLSHR